MGPASFKSSPCRWDGRTWEFQEYLQSYDIQWNELYAFCLISPDSSLALQLLPVARVEGTLRIAREPDSQVTLIDVKSRSARFVFYVGTTTAFEWGTWLSPSTLIIGGRQEGEHMAQHVALWRIDIPGGTCVEYLGRAIPDAKRMKVARAFSQWMVERFPLVIE
jgi:hypothetical protein